MALYLYSSALIYSALQQHMPQFAVGQQDTCKANCIPQAHIAHQCVLSREAHVATDFHDECRSIETRLIIELVYKVLQLLLAVLAGAKSVQLVSWLQHQINL